jgi:hypothetical protein
MRYRFLTFALFFALCSAPAHAQTQPAADGPIVSVSSGWASLWDDETMLGRGVPLGAGFGWPIGDHAVASVDGEWFHHTRDSGYLAVTGNASSVEGNGTWLFGDARRGLRPLVSGSAGVLHSTGTLTTRSVVVGPGGMPASGPSIETPWSMTKIVLGVSAGARIRLSGHLAVRPELRWRSTMGSSRSSAIEPPLLGLGAVVRLEVGIGPR